MAGVSLVSFLIPIAGVKAGDTAFLGQYLFTGSETTSVWLEVKNYTQQF